MRIGVSFPTVEIGHDMGAVRSFTQAAEDLGYSHVRILDHVLGANPEFHPDVDYFAYTHESVTHEPLTLMAYIAGFTERIEMVTGILILPQRQTALVAKQCAEIDVLSNGRLRMGIGVGWNPVEYEALGENFKDRGRRSEEQIEVLRELWTKPVVNYEGKYHKISHAGLNPMPVQQPIPLWIGTGRSIAPRPPERVLRRAGRLGDGWLHQLKPDDVGLEAIARVKQYAEEAGRDPSSIGMEPSLTLTGTDPESWVTTARDWDNLGSSHLALNFRGDAADGCIEKLQTFKDAYGL